MTPSRWDERRLTVDELRDALAKRMSADEEAELLALVRWFTSRYSPLERLRYASRTYRRWVATRGLAAKKNT